MSDAAPHPPAAPDLSAPHGSLTRALTLRAVLLGLFLTVGTAVFAPVNDYLYHDSPFIGNFLPSAVITIVTLLVLIVNPLLGKRRFTLQEMILALAMMLVACGIPTAGFYRLFQTTLAQIVSLSSINVWMREYVNALPNWLLPTKDATSPIIQNFIQGISPRSPTMISSTWAAWAQPYVAWSFFYLPYYAAILLVCALFRKQWIERERLAFPHVTILTTLLAPPEGRRRVSTLWTNRLLWLGILIPVGIHLIDGLHQLNPNFIEIPLTYNVSGAFSEFPWNNLNWFIKTGSVFFAVIGVTWFVPIDVAFSIWFFFLAQEFAVMFIRGTGVAVNDDARSFQLVGIDAVYVIGLLWLARGHLAHVFKNLTKPREPGEFLPWGVIVGGLALCIIIATGFMVYSGVPWWLGAFVFVSLLLWSMIIARVVMESGLVYIQLGTGFEPYWLATFFITPATTAAAKLSQLREWMVSVLSFRLGISDVRENLMGFAGNATRLASEGPPRSRPKFFLLLMLAVGVCCITAGAMHHILDYTYGNNTIQDTWATTSFPTETLKVTQQIIDPTAAPTTTNRPLNFGYGAIAMGLVMLGRGMFTWFPLHPIGLVVGNSYATSRLWQSVLIGWALKLLILRWGGSRAYTTAKPFFLGLIVGESLISVFWGLMSFWIAWPNNAPYRILPT